MCWVSLKHRSTWRNCGLGTEFYVSNINVRATLAAQSNCLAEYNFNNSVNIYKHVNETSF